LFKILATSYPLLTLPGEYEPITKGRVCGVYFRTDEKPVNLVKGTITSIDGGVVTVERLVLFRARVTGVSAFWNQSVVLILEELAMLDPVSACNAAQVCKFFKKTVDSLRGWDKEVITPELRRRNARVQIDSTLERLEEEFAADDSMENLELLLAAVEDVPEEQLIDAILKSPLGWQFKFDILELLEHRSNPGLAKEISELALSLSHRDIPPKLLAIVMHSVTEYSIKEVVRGILRRPDICLAKATLLRHQKYHTDPLFRDSYDEEEAMRRLNEDLIDWNDAPVENSDMIEVPRYICRSFLEDRIKLAKNRLRESQSNS